MNALQLLRDARAAGVRIALDGENLKLDARRPPSPDLRARLKRYKSDLLGLLQPKADGWSHAAWLGLHETRVAVALSAGAPSQADAELWAFEDCVDRWIAINAPAGTADTGCVKCGKAVAEDEVTAVGAGGSPLHRSCAGPWLALRRAEARAALRWLLDAPSPAAGRSSDWTAVDWQAFYDERAGIAEFDGGLSREEAERMAYEACVDEWMRRNPAHSQPGVCHACKGDENGHDPLLPYSNSSGGPIWVHNGCWEPWLTGRRKQAEIAFEAAGLQLRLRKC